MKVYVHIGYPKTATTWFQKKLFPFIENIEYVDKKIIRRLFIQPDSLDFNSSAIRQYFEETYSRDILLSLENFIGGTNNPHLNKFKRKEHALRLQEVFPEAQILLFIRNQIDIIASSYNQYIKDGGTYGINKYINSNAAEESNYNSFLSFYDYQKTIKLYKDLFHYKNMSIYLFEAFRDNPVKFVENFCKCHDFKIKFNQIDYRVEFMSLRSGLKKISRIVNFFTRQKIHFKRYLVHIPFWHHSFSNIIRRMNKFRIFGNVESSIKTLGESNYRYILNHYKESNKILIEEFNLTDIKKYNYPL